MVYYCPFRTSLSRNDSNPSEREALPTPTILVKRRRLVSGYQYPFRPLHRSRGPYTAARCGKRTHWISCHLAFSEYELDNHDKPGRDLRIADSKHTHSTHPGSWCMTHYAATPSPPMEAHTPVCVSSLHATTRKPIITFSEVMPSEGGHSSQIPLQLLTFRSKVRLWPFNIAVFGSLDLCGVLGSTHCLHI